MEPPALPVADGVATDFIIQQSHAVPNLTLLPIGPLTNIATAVIMDEGIVPLVHEVVLMGGVAGRGPGMGLPPGSGVREGNRSAVASFFGSSDIAYEDVSQEAPPDVEPEPRAWQGPPPTAVAASFDKGSRVRHPKFGPGLVIKREKSAGNVFLTVYFERTSRTVKLAEEHAKLEPR